LPDVAYSVPLPSTTMPRRVAKLPGSLPVLSVFVPAVPAGVDADWSDAIEPPSNGRTIVVVGEA